MKYDKYLKSVILCVACSTVLACGSQKTRLSSADAIAPKALVASLHYLPQVEAERTENPYLSRGRIKKASVALFIEARKHFKKQRYVEAKSALTRLTKTDNNLSGPWVMLGEIALNESDYDVAYQHFERAISINANNINAWLRLAYVQRLKGEYLVAQNTYVAALTLWKDCPEAHLNLAVLYDLYLNLPIRAQKHMEAYVFLSEDDNDEATRWLLELQSRTGMAFSLPVGEGAVKGQTDKSLLVAK